MTLLDSIFDFIYTHGSLENILILIILLCIIYYFVFCYDLPPGPWGIPLLGFWPFLKLEDGHLQLKEFREKYGEIFSLTVTGNLFISLSSMKAIKETLLNKSDCFEDRFTQYSLLTLSFGGGKIN